MILREEKYKGVKIQIVKGDITEEDVDAIVNAANENLMHGGGVAGAIVRRGGYEIQRESDEYVRNHGPVKTGDAVVTSGGKLKAKYVIHAVGPVWHGGKNKEDELLYSAVYNSLKRAKELGIESVSLSAISTGIFGFPKRKAAEIFGKAIKDFIDENSHTSLKLIRICTIDSETAKIFAENLKISN